MANGIPSLLNQANDAANVGQVKPGQMARRFCEETMLDWTPEEHAMFFAAAIFGLNPKQKEAAIETFLGHIKDDFERTGRSTSFFHVTAEAVRTELREIELAILISGNFIGTC